MIKPSDSVREIFYENNCQDNAPFSIMDFENGKFGLGLAFTFPKLP